MYQKEVDTNQSLNSENMSGQHIRDYGKEMSEEEVLSLTLSNFQIDQQTSCQDLFSYQDQLQQTLQNIHTYKNQSYQSHNAIHKFIQLASFFQHQLASQNKNQSLEHGLIVHREFVHNVQAKIDAILAKIKRYKQMRLRIDRMKMKVGKINNLIHKKYNIGNYVQQMQLVKELIDRISGKINSCNFDYRFLQEIMSKHLIPYAFYHNYCFNIVCLIISKKLSQNSLIIIKKNAYMSQLFHRIKTYFFHQKDLFKSCSLFLRLIKLTRIINEQHLNIEDGFSYLFKPYFLQVLEEVDQIQCTSFMKARSLMQFSQFTIQTWRQFEQYQIERYILWSHDRHNQLRKNPLIQLVKLKQQISYFQSNYQWINFVDIKINQTKGKNDFIISYLRTALLKIFIPILSQIYNTNLGEQKKLNQKKKNEFNIYWRYCILGKFKQIFGLIGEQLMNYLSSMHMIDNIEDGQFNIDQYYKYYQQTSEILSSEINPSLGLEFKEIWMNIWIRFCILSQNVSQMKQQMPKQDEEINRYFYIKNIEDKLEQQIGSKKSIKSEQKKDFIYGMILNLNLNSCRFFLLREALKYMDKSVQKQVDLIREAAYSQLNS